MGPEFAELWISLDPGVDYKPTVARIQQVVDGYPGLYRDLLTYLKERVKEVLTGTSSSLVVRIYGPSLEVLRQKANEVGKVVADIPGIVDLKVEPQVLVPQVAIRIRPEVAQRLGITPGAIRRAAKTLVGGIRVGEIYEEQKIYQVVVWGADHLRGDLESFRNLTIDTPAGGVVSLGDVADIRIVPTPNAINREAASRRIDVTANVRGEDLGAVAREVQRRVQALEFPREYYPTFLGEYAARQESRNRLLALSLLSLVGIFLILQADFRSTRLALLVMVSLPFALVGGVAAAFLTGGVLSLGSLVGFVTVLGIAARNGIMMVSHWRYLEQEEGKRPCWYLECIDGTGRRRRIAKRRIRSRDGAALAVNRQDMPFLKTVLATLVDNHGLVLCCVGTRAVSRNDAAVDRFLWRMRHRRIVSVGHTRY